MYKSWFWKSALILALTFVPFFILLVDYHAGYQEVSLRGTEISCLSTPCPCSIHEEQIGKKIEAGFDCLINTYGIDLYSYFFVFAFISSLIYQLFQKELNKYTVYFVIASILFWIITWITITITFHIAVVFDDPVGGDYLIMASAFQLFFRTFKYFFLQLFVLDIIMLMVFCAGMLGTVLASIIRKTFVLVVRSKK